MPLHKHHSSRTSSNPVPVDSRSHKKHYDIVDRSGHEIYRRYNVCNNKTKDNKLDDFLLLHNIILHSMSGISGIPSVVVRPSVII